MSLGARIHGMIDDQLNRMQRVPRELLTLVFREYMLEFFSKPRNPLSYHPAILRVCRYWRQTVIEDPRCWTTISLAIDTSLFPNIQRSAGSRTKSGAAYDTLRTYFTRAGTQPIDLTFTLYRYLESLTPHQVEWFSSVLPKMRSYTECGWGTIFPKIITGLENDRYRGLLHLQLSIESETDALMNAKIDLPELRTLFLDNIPVESPIFVPYFLKGLSAPSLSKLRFGSVVQFQPATTVRLLEHLHNYPLLKEIVLKYWINGNHVPQGGFASEPVKSIDQLSLFLDRFEGTDYLCYFISNFPNISSLTLNSRTLSPIQSIQPPNIILRLPRITSLTVLSWFHINCSADALLGLFPTLEYLFLGQHFAFLESVSRYSLNTSNLVSPSYTFKRILESLTLTSQDDDSLRCCPSLRHFTIYHTLFNPQTIIALAACLKLRGPERFRVSLKSCWFTHEDESRPTASGCPLLEGRDMCFTELMDLARRFDPSIDA